MASLQQLDFISLLGRKRRQETQRRERNADRVLARLKEGPASTMDLIAVGGARAIGRCWELRRKGYDIQVEHVAAGLYRYTLKGTR